MELTTIVLPHDLKAKALKWRKAMIFFDQHFEWSGLQDLAYNYEVLQRL